MATNIGAQAFPRPMPGAQYRDEELGMTLRDWFAGMAIRARWGDGTAMSSEEAAAMAYHLADAMLAERDADD